MTVERRHGPAGQPVDAAYRPPTSQGHYRVNVIAGAPDHQLPSKELLADFSASRRQGGGRSGWEVSAIKRITLAAGVSLASVAAVVATAPASQAAPAVRRNPSFALFNCKHAQHCPVAPGESVRSGVGLMVSAAGWFIPKGSRILFPATEYAKVYIYKCAGPGPVADSDCRKVAVLQPTRVGARGEFSGRHMGAYTPQTRKTTWLRAKYVNHMRESNGLKIRLTVWSRAIQLLPARNT